MVNQTQLNAVQNMLKSSSYFSESEKQEWISLLPFMNDKQLTELASILQSAGSTSPSIKPKQVKVEGRKALIAPEPELDLPPPHEAITAPSASIPPRSAPPVADKKLLPSFDPPKPPTHGASVTDFITKNFSAALHRDQSDNLAPKTENKAQVSTPAPALKPPAAAITAPPVIPVQKPPVQVSDIAVVKVEEPVPPAHTEPLLPPNPPVDTVPVEPLARTPQQPVEAPPVTSGNVVATAVDSLEAEQPTSEDSMEDVLPPLHSLEDIRRINVATLRGRGVITLENELKGLAEHYGYFSVQFAFEHAPLYLTYLAIGSRILQNHQTFEEVQADLSQAGRPYLTKPEFEEVNDLLQRIKSA